MKASLSHCEHNNESESEHNNESENESMIKSSTIQDRHPYILKPRQDVIDFLYEVLLLYGKRHENTEQNSWCQELELPSNLNANKKC